MVDSNNKERIEVHDASIIQSNEHPKFKIGDEISNGLVNFIVKGFTRSFAGLAYVLDNGFELCWLTEQADAKCHLVERKQSMNNADALIKKALDYIENNIYDHYDGDNEYGICGGYVKKEEFIKNFKDYMKGE